MRKWHMRLYARFYPVCLDLDDILFFTLAANLPRDLLTTSGVRPGHHSKYGILPLYTTLQRQTVC
jgi:hypothetical protein